MRARLDDIKALGGEVMVVTFTRARNLPAFQRRFAAPLTVIADEERQLYRALGFGRGSVTRVWGLRAAGRYRQLLRGGHQLELPTEDTLQLGGNAIIDAGGRLAWRYAGAGPDDRPSVDEILSELAGVAQR